MIIESLQRDKHNRLAFRCGVDPLDRFLHEHAHQAAAKGLSKTYVAVSDSDETAILAYYSVATCRLEAGTLPEAVLKKLKLPNHDLPASLIGRLAVAERSQGRGMGSIMLLDAMSRCVRTACQIGGVGIVVDAMDYSVVPFYERLGFKSFEPLRLFIPMASVAPTVGIIDDPRGRMGTSGISFAPPQASRAKRAA